MPHHDLHEFLMLLRQPFWRRLIHRNTRRHLVGVGLGTTLMILGSSLATHPSEALPKALWDAFAYGIHGIGFIPWRSTPSPCGAFWEV
jgi:hypothetical protein